MTTGTVVAVDAGTQDRDSTEDALLAFVALLGAPVSLACTHVVTEPAPHWAFTLVLAGTAGPADTTQAGPAVLAAASSISGASLLVVHEDGSTVSAGGPAWREGAQAAAGQLLSGNGRVVLFPGQDELPGTVAVDDVTRLTPITQVIGIAGTPTAGRVLHTRGYVRPQLVDGRLLLHVRPYLDDDGVAPFEVPQPTPCCATHA